MSKLNLLGAWNGGLEKFFAGNSARSFMKTGLTAMTTGSSCGAGDDGKKEETPKPVACGPSCGAADEGTKEQPKPSACGSSCGAGDDKD
jgi:ACGX-repeat protein